MTFRRPLRKNASSRKHSIFPHVLLSSSAMLTIIVLLVTNSNDVVFVEGRSMFWLSQASSSQNQHNTFFLPMIHHKDILHSRSISTIASSTMTASPRRSSYLPGSSGSYVTSHLQRYDEDVVVATNNNSNTTDFAHQQAVVVVVDDESETKTSAQEEEEEEKEQMFGTTTVKVRFSPNDDEVMNHYQDDESTSNGITTTRVEVSLPRTRSISSSDYTATTTSITTAVSDTTSTSTAPFQKGGIFRFLQTNSVKRTHEQYAKKLKNRNHTNIRRKIWHACFGLGFAFMNHIIPKHYFVPFMTLLSSSTLLMELLRYQPGYHWMNDALHAVLGSALRKQEMEDGKFTGSFYFFLGTTTTAAFFPKHAATLGIAQLALADPSASYFGRATRHIYWSRIENGLGGIGRNKGILGFVGGALFCFPFNYRVLSLAKNSGNAAIAALVPGGKQAIIIASLALGFAGAFADLCVPTPALTIPKNTKIAGIPLPPLHVDDNFVVPIVSAAVCTKVFQLLSWQSIQLSNLLIM